jgi:cytochrome c peroxidase
MEAEPIDPLTVLTPEEMRGRDLFNNDYIYPGPGLPFACSTCHATNVQLMDVPTNNGLDVLSSDPGRNGRFRAPSLRNIALSAPYMHDGRFATLREVIEHYDHGIQNSPQLSTVLRQNQIGPVLRLNLSAVEKDALEAFLLTLTDTAFLTDPKFSDPFP